MDSVLQNHSCATIGTMEAPPECAHASEGVHTTPNWWTRWLFGARMRCLIFGARAVRHQQGVRAGRGEAFTVAQTGGDRGLCEGMHGPLPCCGAEEAGMERCKLT
mmetsp:Transcript_79124/g.237080  ORF Transcript_79124/g.237080 Transcript_79124/m.237080 type:complete len:105 (+) Transcript_79124:129-443(+)|eukprot:1784529-Prymnesium_polylepis.2